MTARKNTRTTRRKPRRPDYLDAAEADADRRAQAAELGSDAPEAGDLAEADAAALRAIERKPEPLRPEPPFDVTGAIIDFECGNLDEDGVIRLFQHLVDTGLAWTLQGCYGRAARDLILAGLVQPDDHARRVLACHGIRLPEAEPEPA